MFTWKRLLVAACIFIVLLGTFTTLILPGIIVTKAEQWVADTTGRRLDIERLSINPLTLVVDVDQLSLSDTDQTTRFVAWEKLRVSFSLRSLYHMAPILREIRLVGPYLHIERLDAKTFNFSDLLSATTETPQPGDKEDPARFSLNNIVIENGRIELVDRSPDRQVSHTVRDLNLAIPFIGNLPYLVEEPVQPRFSAVINDSPLEMNGDLTPFAETREFSLNLALYDVDLPYYLAYLPLELPVDLRNGRLSLDLELRYRAGMQQKPEFLASGVINLAALNIWDKQNEQLFFLPLLRAEIASSRPLEQVVHLTSLDIYNLEVNVARDRHGVWNHARLEMPQERSPTPPATADETSQPFNLRIDRFQVRDAEVHFTDQQPAGGFATVIRELNLKLDNFTLGSAEPAPFVLDLKTDFAETLDAQGRFLAVPFTIEVQTEAHNLLPAAYAPYYADAYALPLGGKLDVSANLDIGPDQPLLIHNGSIAWHNAALAFNGSEGLDIEDIEVAGLSFNLAENRLAVDSAAISQGKMTFSRDRQGDWSLMSHNFPILSRLTEAPASQPTPVHPQEDPEFSYRIGELAVIDWSFDVHDRLPAIPAHFQAEQFNLRIENLAAPQKVQSPFEFSTKFGSRGDIALTGTASLVGQSVSLNADLRRISLATFAPYLAEQTNLVLRDGSFDARLQASVKPGPDTFLVSFGGDLGVNRFHLLDGTHREDLLKWDSLQVAGLDGRWGPLSLAVESITMSDYFARVLIDENAQLNLVDAFRKDSVETENSGPADTPPKPANAAADRQPPPDIQINQVTLQGGQVEFTDRNLSRPFHADMRELGGSIHGLSSSAEARAGVDLRGKLRNQSPLVIAGEVNPLAENIFLNLKFNFSDIEMSPMSPYSGTYLGYLIEKGKLHLALEYLVQDGKLKAKNEIFLDQFTFGEAVASEKAIGLPVKLAVALLKDRNGEIHLDIPVSGELDNPQFSIVGVVWKIIRNLLVKAATSPLALLGALAGGADEDFSSVVFAYGSARLAPPEREKLDQLAKALQNRPSLTLEIKGFVDPDNDPEGFRREQLRLKIEQAWQQSLDAGAETRQDATAQTPQMTPEEYSAALWEVYKQADFPKPRNFLGMIKHLPDEELEKLIYTNTEAGPEELARLAQLRAQAVRNYLVDQAEVPPERVFLTAPDHKQPPERMDAARSRVEFGVAVK